MDAVPSSNELHTVQSDPAEVLVFQITQLIQFYIIIKNKVLNLFKFHFYL